MTNPHADATAAAETARSFAITGELLGVERHERGHIHDTFISTWQRDGAADARQGRQRYLHQHMNEVVFGDIETVMHNVALVTRHLAKTSSDDTTTLRLVPTREGHDWLRAPSGAWRCYEFVENTCSVDRCTGAGQAFAAAHAFGSFQARLAGLDPDLLRATIPDFFDPSARLRQLDAAVAVDPRGRAAAVAAELELVAARRSMADTLEHAIASGAFPRRIVHGDTKLNNVLFDVDSGAARCIVDLDTCMPAWALYDYGDLVRFTAATCAEDAPDPAAAGVDPTLYRAVTEGYLDAAHTFLTTEEHRLLPFAARLVTLMIGVRFLTDHIAGDVYFRVTRPGQNLDRARVQLAMVRAMEELTDTG